MDSNPRSPVRRTTTFKTARPRYTPSRQDPQPYSFRYERRRPCVVAPDERGNTRIGGDTPNAFRGPSGPPPEGPARRIHPPDGTAFTQGPCLRKTLSPPPPPGSTPPPPPP